MRISAASISFVVAICWTTATVSAFTTPAQRASTIGIQQQQQLPKQRSVATALNEQDDKKGNFFSNMFTGNSENNDGATALRGKLAPHPSVRPHISPLNRFGPDPQDKLPSDPLPVHPDVRSGTLPNGLPYVILPNKSPPGRFEAHLQVFSGSGTSIMQKQYGIMKPKRKYTYDTSTANRLRACTEILRLIVIGVKSTLSRDTVVYFLKLNLSFSLCNAS